MAEEAGALFPAAKIATPPPMGRLSRSNLYSNLATIRQEVREWETSAQTNSKAGLSSLTTPALDRPYALNASNYPITPHNWSSKNDKDTTPGATMFSLLLLHRPSLGSSGYFWYHQVGIKYLKEHNSKTSMLLGMSSLMDILSVAINGFALHPLDETYLLPVLVNNRPEDGFLGLQFLLSNIFWSKTNGIGQRNNQ
jgi:hypothetical protein